jgi:subtilisin family serine protease
VSRRGCAWFSLVAAGWACTATAQQPATIPGYPATNGVEEVRRPGEKVSAQVRLQATAAASVRVFILLTKQPHREMVNWAEAMSDHRRRIEAAERKKRAASSAADLQGTEAAQAEADSAVLDARRIAQQGIRSAISSDQDEVGKFLASIGARGVRRYWVRNMFAAEVPSSMIAQLQAHPLIDWVFLAEPLKAQLNVSVPSLGAASFWNHSFTGTGQSVAVIDTGVNVNHPAFAGLTIISQVFLDSASLGPQFADDASSPADLVGHGTHVAGIVASRGSASWTTYKGVAPGLGTLYNYKAGFKTTTGGGLFDAADVFAALEALLETPVHVINFSAGGALSSDSDGWSMFFDEIADTFHVTIAVAAGNDGCCLHVGTPGVAYNVITVANMDDNGTVSRSDDSIDPSSSTGPTAGGRNKPDVAAPGSPIYSAAFDWSGGTGGANPDFVGYGGTSMAAPHIAGAAALLRHTGITDPLAIKALLINSADGSGWQSTQGWGYANLTSAFNQRHALSSSVASGKYQFFAGHVPADSNYTLVWNQHISGSTAVFNPLKLALYDSTGTQIASSASAAQNVQQFHSYSSGDLVLKVSAAGAFPAPAAPEAFAVAMSQPGMQAVNGPTLGVTCTAPASVTTGAPFTVTCTVTNSGNLTAFGVHGPLTRTGGPVGSDATFGAIAAGESVSRNWTVTVPASGPFTFHADVTSASFGETFSGSGSYSATATAGPLPCTGACSIVASDFNGDGRKDITLYVPATGAAYEALSSGTGTFNYYGQSWSRGYDVLRTGDFNNDGRTDIVLYNRASGAASLGLANASQGFTFSGLGWSAGYDAVEAADLNNDGRSDLVLYNRTTGTAYALISTGGGAFTYRYQLWSPGYTTLRLADFNGDGKADIILYNRATGAAHLGTGDGAGGFSFKGLNWSPGYDVIEPAKLKGTAFSDLILYNATTGTAYLLFNNQAGGFSSVYNLWSAGITHIRTGDWNGDGKWDIVLYNQAAGTAFAGLSNGATGFTFQGLNWSRGYDWVEPRDLNGDGRTDLILYNSASGTEYSALSTGGAGFTYQYNFWGPGRALSR